MIPPNDLGWDEVASFRLQVPGWCPAAGQLETCNLKPASTSIRLCRVASIGLIACAVSCSIVAADSVAPNPYATIASRNVFRLTPPPPPAPPESEPSPNPPLIRLTGLVKFGSVAQVLLATVPGEAKDIRSFVLKEGERDDFLQVVKVHPDNDHVDIINSGLKQTLSLKTDSSTGHRASSGLNVGNPHVRQ